MRFLLVPVTEGFSTRPFARPQAVRMLVNSVRTLGVRIRLSYQAFAGNFVNDVPNIRE